MPTSVRNRLLSLLLPGPIDGLRHIRVIAKLLSIYTYRDGVMRVIVPLPSLLLGTGSRLPPPSGRGRDTRFHWISPMYGAKHLTVSEHVHSF